MNDLITKDEHEMTPTLDINTIISRMGNTLPALSKKAIVKIQERMPEIHRAVRSFGRSSSPTENKLMTLTFLSHSPYKRLQQCLAEIEARTPAIKEAYFRYLRNKNKLNRLKQQLKDSWKINKYGNKVDLDEFDRVDIDIDIQEILTNIADADVYVYGVFKSIGDFQDAYRDIIKANNIPKKWDEKDFVESEFIHHIKAAFTNAMADVLMEDRLNVSSTRYFTQYGINPITALKEISDYLKSLGEDPGIEEWYDFLDRMYEKYKDCPKKAMKRIGLDEIYNKDFIYTEDK